MDRSAGPDRRERRTAAKVVPHCCAATATAGIREGKTGSRKARATSSRQLGGDLQGTDEPLHDQGRTALGPSAIEARRCPGRLRRPPAQRRCRCKGQRFPFTRRSDPAVQGGGPATHRGTQHRDQGRGRAAARLPNAASVCRVRTGSREGTSYKLAGVGASCISWRTEYLRMHESIG